MEYEFGWRPRFTLNSYLVWKLSVEHVACSRLSVSEDDQKSERATSRISGEWDLGEKRRGTTRPHSLPTCFFNPPLTESLEQAMEHVVYM